MSEQVNYGKNYVALSIQGVLVPFQNFRYRASTNAEEIHLPSNWSSGWHNLPPQFTATFTLYNVSTPTVNVSSLVHGAQLAREDVSLVVAKKENTGPDALAGGELAFTSINLSRGRIIDVSGEGISSRDIATLIVTARFNKFEVET